MSMEKRLVLFFALSVGLMFGTQFALDRMGMLPKPAPKPPVAKDANEARPDEAQPDKNLKVDAPVKDTEKDTEVAATEPAEPSPDVEPAPDVEPKPAAIVQPRVELAAPSELVLGSTDHSSPYYLEVQLSQRGAAVESLYSSRYEAELKEGHPHDRPLALIQPEGPARSPSPLSFALSLTRMLGEREQGQAEEETDPLQGEGLVMDEGLDQADTKSYALERRLWEVVRDDQGRAVHPVTRPSRGGGKAIQGQEVRFQTLVDPDLGLNVTKVYRLWPGQDGFELDLEIDSPRNEQTVAYQLFGPKRLPIEGEWYTGTFRDVFFGLVDTDGAIEIDTTSAYEVVKQAQPGKEPERFTRPIAYAGVENQYFAVFLQPVPVPDSPEKSRLDEARAVLADDVPGKDWQKADVSVELESKPIELGENRKVTHSYRVFAGPKTVEALAPYQANDLASYRKGWHLWVVGDLGASFMSKYFIRPLLGRIYSVTEYLAGLFGGRQGNWGISIILLTVVVRLILFPLGRKQARAAKKMQDLQPLMAELKVKYAEDKERLTRETFAMYKQHGANPMGGCLPALVQLPVLIGLWQSLNSSVALRNTRFLWIDNLAAPDMLFKFPFPIPLVGQWLGPYFNLLPIFVDVLMLVQTKLFSPPPTTPEAETQQKMMKYMMIFMAFIFYKVPAGLGIYFITSSLWQISERLLLPKTSLGKAPELAAEPETGKERHGRGDTGPGTPGVGAKPKPRSGDSNGGAGSQGGRFKGLRDRFQQILDDAEKQRTVHNSGGGTERNRERDRNRPRPKPGRKR